MLSLLKNLVAPNAHKRRIMAGVCAVLTLLTIFFSSVLLAADADHECDGHDCPICLEMQGYVANFQLVGSSVAPGEILLPTILRFNAESVPCAIRAPATTLQSLDVRFDE